VYLAPGRVYASADDVRLTTILGSCVAVCICDEQAGVGGMNHFLLPEGPGSLPRFGESAVPMLIAELLALGAERSRMRAKVFGGACVLDAFRSERRSLGERNVETARTLLRAANVRVVSEDVLGESGRKVEYEVRTGTAWVKRIEARD
jgi:chemotaxis protein CheD